MQKFKKGRCGYLPKAKKDTGNKPLPANKQKGKKKCTRCHKEKNMLDFYSSNSPLFSIDKRVPLCKKCIQELCVNSETGEIDEIELNKTLRIIDKPYYKDSLASSYQQFLREHSYIEEEDVKKYGDKVLGLYFKNIMLRQDKDKSYEDSEKEGFIHHNSNTTVSEKEKIIQKYSDIQEQKNNLQANNQTRNNEEELIYDDKWMGKYTKKDIDYLNNYYSGLERDYKIITENHRDYARKIAKASLQMDKAFDEMINGVDGADARYKNAREAFDTLSKSAKFSESTRSVNDVGISSFSKVAAMVEAHNWIPEHKPLKKDTIDEMIDYLSTITKSL